MGERILVCGGRTYGGLPNVPFDAPWVNYEADLQKAELEKALFEKVMNAAKAKYNIECIIEGGAKGADRLANRWATRNGIQLITCKADWDTLGKKAGIVRNATMLEEHTPSLVIAFAGGTGTTDMVTRSRKAGVRVIEVPTI